MIYFPHLQTKLADPLHANNLPAYTECTGTAYSPLQAINGSMAAYIMVFSFG